MWPIEERPVPQSDVPGEKTSPTQPFPTKPPAYARNYLKVPDDLIDFTPELRAQALENVEALQARAVAVHAAGARQRQRHRSARSTSATPAAARTGRASAYDPETHTVFAQREQRRHRVARLVAAADGLLGHPLRVGHRRAAVPEVLGPGDCCAADSPRAGAHGAAPPRRAPRRRRRPRRRPPPPAAAAVAAARSRGCRSSSRRTARSSAINLDRGELMWQVPHGDTPDNVRNHPALQGPEHPEDRPGRAASALMVTKTLVVARRSAGDDDAGASARRDAARLRQDRPARKSARSGCRRRRAARR